MMAEFTRRQKQILALARARKRKAEAEAAAAADGAAASSAAPPPAPVASDLPIPGSLNEDGTTVPMSVEEMKARQPVQGTPLDRWKSSPDMLDRAMALVDYVDDTGAIVVDRAGEGAARVAGLPVDAVNVAPMLLNFIPGFRPERELGDLVTDKEPQWGPITDHPVMGGDYINELRKGFGLIPDAPKPSDPFQEVVGRVGEEIGANAVPVLGVVGKAGRMGVQAVRESGPLSRLFLEQAAVDPARFVGREAAASTAAGTGAGMVNLVVDRNTPEGQWADMAGALGGAGIAGLGEVVLRGAGNVAGAIFQRPKYIDQTVKDAVVDRIAKNAGLQGDTPDTSGLVDTIMGSPSPEAQLAGAPAGARPSEVVPGFQESLADRTGNAGLASLEYSRQAGPNAGMFTTRRSQNADAVDSAISGLAPTETPGAFRQELDDVRDTRLRIAAGETEQAQSEFDQIIQTMVAQMGAEERGATVRAGVTNAERAARESENELWRAIHGEVDPAPLADNLDATREGLTMARQQAVSDLDPVVDIPRRLAEPVAGADGAAPAPAGPVDIQELTDLRSTMLKEQRDALSAGDRNRAEAIGRYIDEVNGYLDSGALPEGTRAQIDEAKGVSRAVNETFNRPNDPLADVLATKEGRPDVPDSAVARKFVQPDSGQASNIDRLLAQTDLSSQAVPVREAIKDEIIAGIDRNNLAREPNRLDQYLNQYGRVFERFPELRDEIRNAAATGRRLDDTSSAERALQEDIGMPDGSVKGRGPVGRYLEYSDANSERAINEVLNAKDPGKAADDLLTFIGDNPRAVEGARAAFWQKLKKEGQSTDNSQRSMSGKRAWRGDWLKSFLDNPATSAVAERLYRDNPEHLERIREIADVLDNVDLRQRGKAVGTSGTAQGVNPVLTPETLQSRFYAYMRGAVGGTYLATSIAAVVARRAVRKAQTDAIDRLTDQALLNPELAAELLRENNPANRAALARKAKLWLGNEAATFIDLLDGEDVEQETK